MTAEPPDLARIAGRVAVACDTFLEVAAAYLFGSVLQHGFGRCSNVNVAVLLYPEHRDCASVTLPLTVALKKVLDRPVDVALLNRAVEVLKYEMRRTGRLVFERSPTVRKRFEIVGRKHFEGSFFNCTDAMSAKPCIVEMMVNRLLIERILADISADTLALRHAGCITHYVFYSVRADWSNCLPL